MPVQARLVVCSLLSAGLPSEEAQHPARDHLCHVTQAVPAAVSNLTMACRNRELVGRVSGSIGGMFMHSLRSRAKACGIAIEKQSP